MLTPRLNITASLLDRWLPDESSASRTAVIGELEDGSVRSLTYRELAAEVNRCANALRSLGFGKGDAIGLYMPMTVEIVVGLLAIARIGAVILPCFLVSARCCSVAPARRGGERTADG